MSTRIMYLRSSNNHPVGCIAINYKYGTNTLTYQVSVQNPNDSFNREIARQLAIGRLVEKPIEIVVYRDSNVHDVSIAVMEHIAYDSKGVLPSRAIKSARLWVQKNVIDAEKNCKNTGKQLKLNFNK